MRTPFNPSQEWREHTAGTWNKYTSLFFLSRYTSLTSPTISPAIIAWLWLHLLSVLHHALYNPCAGSMTGCWATVIRAGWYRQRTQRPLMFPPPGQIFLAHLEWARTGINMVATWRGVRDAQSQSATVPGPQQGNQLRNTSTRLLNCLNSWTA